MHFLNVLYEKPQQNNVLDFLSNQFGANAPHVQVNEIVNDSLIKVAWEFDTPVDSVATALTEEFPSLVIETSSTTGLESTSRYFNGSQLW